MHDPQLRRKKIVKTLRCFYSAILGEDPDRRANRLTPVRGLTAWDYVEPIDAGPNKVHFRVQFTRFLADESPIGSYKSLYIVTLQYGRWAVQGRSSWAEKG
jgi:hypothetical protein